MKRPAVNTYDRRPAPLADRGGATMTAELPAAPWRAECLIEARQLVMSFGPTLALAARPDDRLDVSEAWREALFASALQPSDAPTAEAVAEAIDSTVRQFGIGGCVGRMAQEFGDHPEAAVERMRWVCRLVAETPVVLDTDAARARDAGRGIRA